MHNSCEKHCCMINLEEQLICPALEELKTIVLFNMKWINILWQIHEKRYGFLSIIECINRKNFADDCIWTSSDPVGGR